ncbi:MAG TPA: pentapeptide repeat-containing protein [Methylocella sp.]
MGDETISSNGEPGTKEAEALATALNHSAERVQTLWFSFLTFMLYLAIAAGTTTHRMLFLQSPLNLPVLNIPLPLLAFYILTPIIFVVFHFYMLLNLVLLARTAKSFEDALARAFPEDGEARENFRMRIENTLFVQLLVGGRLEREGLNAKLLSAMALITLALAPVALLLMFEVKFLPYHNEAITWWHRGLLALDLALVWTLWPGYRSGWGVRLWPKATWWLAAPGAGSAAALAYAVAVATFPDEHIYLATNWLHGIAPVSTLDLQREDLIDDAKLAHIIEKGESSTGAQRWVATLPLAGRDLTRADLDGADVRHVDFSGAILNRATLGRSWAKSARLDNAQLQGASLKGAQLQGASLNDAQLQGASLDAAQLQGASLDEAQLRGASLNHAQLQGASLDDADLQGASLDGAKLQGASLKSAQLQGASLVYAQLQGTSLDGAQLQGASLSYSPLWGLLIGGFFSGGAQLQGASFVDACVWRADASNAAWGDTRVELPKADKLHECDWTSDRFAALKQLIAKQVSEGDPTRAAIKRAAMERIEQRLDPTKALEGEKDMAKIWAVRESEAPTPEAYAKGLAGQWRKAGCAAEGAPYVLRALLARLHGDVSPFAEDSPEKTKLAAAFLDEAHCAGAHGLSEADKAKLKEIAAPAPPPAPKP